MKFSASAVAAIVIASSVANHAFAFTAASHRRVVSLAKTAEASSRTTDANQHGGACGCSNCRQCSCGGLAAGLCRCFFFARMSGDIVPTRLFSSNVDAVAENDETLPVEVEALDGVESADELHNLERPARQSIAKRPGGGSRSSGKPLTEYTVGDTVTGMVKTLTAYGAFIDIGAESDGLLHISNLAAAFVADVKEVLQPGQECQVRILEINPEKKQLALTMLTSEEQSQADAKKQQSSSRASGGGGGASNVKKNSILINQLIELDIDPDTFVTGTVVNIVEFGAFVRVDCSQFDDAISGEIDGLVHVSQLQGGSGRVSVADVVQEGQEVQVRLKNIDGQKISLTMMSVEDEQAKMDDGESSGGGSRGERGDRGGGGSDYDGEVDPHPGNREWEASYAENMVGQPEFRNGAVLWTTNKKK